MSEDEVGKQAADVSPEEIRGMLQISFITCTALAMSNVKDIDTNLTNLPDNQKIKMG